MTELLRYQGHSQFITLLKQFLDGYARLPIGALQKVLFHRARVKVLICLFKELLP